MGPGTPELTLRDYLAPVRQRWWLVLFIVVIVVALTYEYERSRPKTYIATTELYFGQPIDQLSSGGSASTTSLGDAAALLTSSEMSERVAKLIGYRGDPASLGRSVTASPSSSSDFITVTATTGTYASAPRIANGFARAFVLASAPRLNRLVLPGTSESLTSPGLAAAEAEVAAGLGGVTQVNPATGALVLSKTPKRDAVIAGIVALIGSVLLTYLLYRIDPRIKTASEAADAYGHPVLVSVMHDSEIRYELDGAAALPVRATEAFRALQLTLARSDHAQTVLVTSAVPDEGKSTIARNLALAYAESGARTILVDADFRRPSIAGMFGINREPGLSEVISRSQKLGAVIMRVPTATAIPSGAAVTSSVGSDPLPGFVDRAELAVLPSGRIPANPPAAINSPEFLQTIQELRDTHDVVILDSPPVNAASDTALLLANADAALIVSRCGITDRRDARLAATVIDRVASARVIGLVFNDLARADSAGYGGYYGYGVVDEPGPVRRWLKRVLR